MKVWEVELQDARYGEESLPLEKLYVIAEVAEEAIAKAIKHEKEQYEKEPEVDVIVSKVEFVCEIDVE